MRAADAPPAGWYPDPDSRTRLRWWDGLDWAEARRAPPSDAEILRYELPEVASPQARSVEELRAAASATSRADAQQLITEVRNVARAEVDRAAQEFTHRAQQAVQSVTPLIDQYTSRILRWVKFISVLLLVLIIAWFTFQTIAQATFFEWLGDRIDNLTDENGLGAVVRSM